MNRTKQEQEAFLNLHDSKNIHVDILNISNLDALPAPFVVSKKQADNHEENKLLIRLTNLSNDRLIIGGPGKASGLYINFADLMDVEFMDRISVFISGTPVHASVALPLTRLRTPNGNEIPEILLDPSTPPRPNPDHMCDEFILYIWPEREIYLGIGDTMNIQFENVVSEFYPSLRYIGISWQFKIDDLTFDGPEYEEGFHQLAMELKRPPGFVEPPLPVQVHWLNNQNTIFTSKSIKEKEEDVGTEAIKNELYFAMSNVGLKEFVLDCSKHSRGVPYFELIMVGVPDGVDGDLTSAVARASDLVAAEIESFSPDDKKKDNWKVHKFIQGPIVKWEIRPDLQQLEEKNGKKIILGKNMDATATFRIYNLISKLKGGVALVYFRFYNMPEHDDGQLVLFMEKRSINGSHNMAPQLSQESNGIANPFSWKVEEKNYELTTVVSVGGESLPLEMNVNGEVSISNSSPPDIHKLQTKTNKAAIKLIGTKKGSSMGRVVKIEATEDDNDKGAKMIFSTRDSSKKENPDNLKDYDLTPRMVIDSKGNVGIGISNPEEKVHLRSGNFRIDGGEIQSWGPLTFHPDVDKGGDDIIKFLNSNGEENARIHSNGNMGIGVPSPGQKLEVNGNIAIRSEAVKDKSWGALLLGTNNSLYKKSWAGISSYNTGGDDQSDLRFYTSYGARKERMRINQHGDIGIKNDDPKAPLSIKGDGKENKPDEALHITSDCILFGGKNDGRQDDSAQISAGRHIANSLNIVGMSAADKSNRRVDVWAEGGFNVKGTIYAKDGYLRVDWIPNYNEDDTYDLTWNPGNQIISKEGSSKRYKKNITTLDRDFHAILELLPRQYKMRKAYGNSKKNQIGYIAEEADELGLSALVIYDQEGRPDGIKYKKVVIYLKEVVKDQQEKIETLEQEVTDLKQAFKSMQKEITALNATMSI